jgi:crotonobetainyl-CoA:carnitine CoA-transferase CaiB-like acyl-CoA transferase
MAGPLAGLRVLDLSIMAAGPWVGALLGELGADVVKVEPPAGDGTRWVEPLQRGMGTNYICLNVNKRGIVLDLKDPQGRQQAVDLAGRSDVFIQNFRGGVVERLGLGYPVLRARNPRLVYCSISGFGESGPLAREACADFIMQAFSGFARLNGAPGDELEAFRFTGFIDLTTSIAATQAVLAALVERDRSGLGQKVEVSMLEAALEIEATRIAELLGAGARPLPRGSESPGLVPDRAFATADREVFVTVHDAAQWRGFCAAAGRPDLADDPRFASGPARVEHRDALNALIEPIFRDRPAIWWLRVFERHGVPCALAQHFETIRHHAQVRDNGMVAELDTPDWGRVLVGGVPWHFSRTRCAVEPPPRPGQHTSEILDEGPSSGRPEVRREASDPAARA